MSSLGGPTLKRKKTLRQPFWSVPHFTLFKFIGMFRCFVDTSRPFDMKIFKNVI